MATGQTLLDQMEVLHPELRNQAGEPSVPKSLIALNMAQDFMESVLARYPDVLGGSMGTVTTAANVETTVFPAGLLRLDKLQRLDPGTLRPVATLEPIQERGGHLPGAAWPLSLAVASSSPGAPVAYDTDGVRIYWSPLPDGVYSVRWYGLQAAADITAAGTFAYPDIALAPVATLAVRIIRTGLDDTTEDLKALAGDLFDPMLAALGNFRRERAAGYRYRYRHST